MCRSIKVLRETGGAEPRPTADDTEIHEAALQFVRKVSGYRKPSPANAAAFEAAVAEVATTTRALLDGIVVGRRA